MTMNITTQEINSIANILAAKKEMVVDSVDFLLTALKLNDATGIQMALRSLGVNDQDEMFEHVNELTSSLHSIVDQFRLSMIENPNEGLSGAVSKLKQVIKMNFEAADKTLKECETQGFLYRDQRENLEKLEASLKESGMPIPEGTKQYLLETKKNLDKMQERNHKVIMAQSFPDISSKAVNKVIELVESIEKQIFSLTIACSEEDGIKDMVSAMRSRRK